MRYSKIIIPILITLTLFFSGGCGNETEDYEEREELVIFAAASLTESLNELVSHFKDEYPGVKVQLNLASTSRLRAQVEQGVHADIFLSANKKHYDALKGKGYIAEGREFLANKMVVALSSGNSALIQELEDLTKECKIVIAHEEVPAGSYALQVLDKLEEQFGRDFKEKVLNNVASKENNVKQVLAKVMLGEADAAFVYSSDVTSEVREKVRILDIPEDFNIRASYWAAVLKGSESKKDAKNFFEFLCSQKGKEVFEKYGFIVN